MKEKTIIKIGYLDRKIDIKKSILKGRTKRKRVFKEVTILEIEYPYDEVIFLMKLVEKEDIQDIIRKIQLKSKTLSIKDIQYLINLSESQGIQAVINKIKSKSIIEWLHENKIDLSIKEVIQAAQVRQKFHRNSRIRKDSIMSKYKKLLIRKSKEEVLQKAIEDRNNKIFSNRYFYNIKAMIDNWS